VERKEVGCWEAGEAQNKGVWERYLDATIVFLPFRSIGSHGDAKLSGKKEEGAFAGLSNQMWWGVSEGWGRVV